MSDERFKGIRALMRWTGVRGWRGVRGWFGRIFSALNTREMQFGLRYRF